MLFRAAAFAGCILLSLPALGSSCIWFADDDGLRQIDTDTNLVSAIVPLRDPWRDAPRLVVNAGDCGVWTLDKRDGRLLRYGENGSLEREIGVRSLDPRLHYIEHLELDAYDGSLWVADERRLVHVSPDGQLLGAFTAPDDVRHVRVALDQHLWVLGERQLWHYDAQGTLVASHALDQGSGRHAVDFIVDSLGGLLWLADRHHLVRLQLSDLAAAPLRTRLAHRIRRLALDPQAGKTWVASGDVLLAYSRAGVLLHSVDPALDNVRKPAELAFDPVSRSLWVGADRSAARFTDTGTFVARFAADGDAAVAAPALRVAPTLTLVRPPQAAVTNDPRPQFTLAYGAQCNASACAFASDYFGGYQLSATLNGQAVGTQFVFDAISGQANFTPALPLAEGANSFSAQVKDAFGHSSALATLGLTVDTVAPRFLTLSPAEGSTLSTPSALIQGTIDDPGATVALAGTGIAQTGTSFAFPVVLAPGVNTFSLSATDRAGNAGFAVLHLVLASASVSITSPLSGATIAADSVTVSGTFEGPAGSAVTVNGIAAVTTGSSFVVASVPLQPGANTLTAVTTAPNRESATQSISVTGAAPAAVRVTPVVAQGLAPLDATFTLINTSGRSLLSVQADYTGTGSFESLDPGAPLAHRYTAAGTYQAVFRVVNDLGTTFSQTIAVVVQDPIQLDQSLRTSWNGFAGALAARDTAQALQYFNAQGQTKYRPVLEALSLQMPSIVASFSVPQTVSLTGGVGEYGINRTIDGVNQLFLIYFVQDSDGVWRLDSM